MTQQDEQARTANRRLTQWRVKWLIEHSTSHSSQRRDGVLTILCSEIRHCAKHQNVMPNFKRQHNE